MHPTPATSQRPQARPRGIAHVRPFRPLVVEAADPADGAPIFLAPGGRWTRHPAAAALARSPAEAAALLVAAEARPDLARDPALVELAGRDPCLAGAA